MPKLAHGETLTTKEQLFCLDYARHFNATRAAIAAGYSKKSAYVQGSQILARPRVRAELRRLLIDHNMPSEEILARLSAQARANLADLVELDDIPVVDKDGKHIGNKQTIRIKPDAIEKYGYLIKMIKPTNYGVQIELHDTQRAQEILVKKIDLFEHIFVDLGLDNLTDAELNRLSGGEDPIKVLKAFLGRVSNENLLGENMINLQPDETETS